MYLNTIIIADDIKWFRGWSAGNILLIFFLVISTWIIYFYMSNLQASLVKQQYENPINNIYDIVEEVNFIIKSNFKMCIFCHKTEKSAHLCMFLAKNRLQISKYDLKFNLILEKGLLYCNTGCVQPFLQFSPGSP